MIVVLFQKRLKRPANDNDLLLCDGNEAKAWAHLLRSLAGLPGGDEAELRSRLRRTADMVDPRPGVIDFPREWTVLPAEYAHAE